MPLGVLDNGREKTTLVFDTWADVGEGALVVRWDCTLDEEARSIFEVLARHLFGNPRRGRHEGESLCGRLREGDGSLQL